MNTAVQNVADEGNLLDAHIYYKNRRGLYVWKPFSQHILSKVAPAPYRDGKGMTSSLLLRDMSNQEIINEILGGIEQSRANAITLDQITAKIDLQPNGEDGELLNNGCANIFYVLSGEALVSVGMGFISDEQNWHLNAWLLTRRGHWRAGSRVFHNTTSAV